MRSRVVLRIRCSLLAGGEGERFFASSFSRMKKSIGLIAAEVLLTVGRGLFLGVWKAQWDLSAGVSSGSEGDFSWPKAKVTQINRPNDGNNPVFFKFFKEILSM